MAMDFFESQDVARKKTGLLVVLFVVAVLAIMVMIYIVVAGALTYGRVRHGGEGSSQWIGLLDPLLLLGVGLGTIAVIGGASLFKMAQLRSGGSVIAESLGGRRLHADSTDPLERKVLNVVEEMSIASGTPTPPVFLMDKEEGINAFAAGWSPQDAVIGVTRGTVETLSRDELQGVIAHEFSHILNGDMRLNIKLIGILHGILVIGIIGYFLLRTSFFAGGARRRSSKEGGGGAAAILGVGLGLMVVGFVGTFFGNLIKAAVSRQREFLADASAVQFTRNPDGIAGALKKIGGCVRGSKIDHPNAPQSSHMFFGQSLTSGFSAMFATHPPLPQRIRRIDPGWDGSLIKVAALGKRGVQRLGGDRAATRRQRRSRAGDGRHEAIDKARALQRGRRGAGASVMPQGMIEAITLGVAVSQIGRPTIAHVQYAAQLVEKMPKALIQAAHESYGARALVYAMLVSSDVDSEIRKKQLQSLQDDADKGVFAETAKLLPILKQLETRARLPLIDMTLPALGALSPAQYQVFRKNMNSLIDADQQVDLFEWSLRRILLTHLEPKFSKVSPPRVRHYALNRLSKECGILLSAVARSGQDDPARIQQAFDQAVQVLATSGPALDLLDEDQCDAPALDDAVTALNEAAPKLKRRIIQACATAICADRKVTVGEAELLRAISSSLACPMPPILPGQAV